MRKKSKSESITEPRPADVETPLTSSESSAAPAKAGAKSTKRSPGAKSTARKTSAKAKSAPAAARKRSSTPRPKRARVAEPSDADIRLRAYFIAERRVQLALQGDPAMDWLEAKEELLKEAREARG